MVVSSHSHGLWFFGIVSSTEGYCSVCISLAPNEIVASSYYWLQSHGYMDDGLVRHQQKSIHSVVCHMNE